MVTQRKEESLMSKKLTTVPYVEIDQLFGYHTLEELLNNDREIPGYTVTSAQFHEYAIIAHIEAEIIKNNQYEEYRHFMEYIKEEGKDDYVVTTLIAKFDEHFIIVCNY